MDGSQPVPSSRRLNKAFPHNGGAGRLYERNEWGRREDTHASPFTVKTRGKSHVRCDAFQRCEREKREMLVNRNKNGSNLLIPFRHLRRE